EPPAHREPFRLERREPRLDARGGEAGGVGEGFGGHGAENLEPGPQDLGERRVLRPALVRGPRRRLDRRNDPRRGEKGPERREARSSSNKGRHSSRASSWVRTPETTSAS